jgi:signal transduction histidine kinase
LQLWAWLCDRAGVIQQILCDVLSPSAAGAPGQSVADQVDAASRDKAGYLLAEVQTRGAAFDWELNVPIEGRVVTLHFSGVANGDSLLMVAARNRNDLAQLYEDLMRVNNEQVNALRLAIKDQTELARACNDRGHGEYDELTRLNNELIDLQRTLAKKLEQVLNNLISNAVKFSYPQSAVEISVTVEGARVILAVRDHGQGIPAAELDRLFKPFSRTSVKSTAGEHSTGLGLSITRKIVVEHGGDIWVESAVGQGSTFYAALPIADCRLLIADC